MTGPARLAGVALMILAFGGLAGCNTVEGVGEDLSATGRAIDRAAEKAKN